MQKMLLNTMWTIIGDVQEALGENASHSEIREYLVDSCVASDFVISYGGDEAKAKEYLSLPREEQSKLAKEAARKIYD